MPLVRLELAALLAANSKLAVLQLDSKQISAVQTLLLEVALEYADGEDALSSCYASLDDHIDGPQHAFLVRTVFNLTLKNAKISNAIGRFVEYFFKAQSNSLSTDIADCIVRFAEVDEVGDWLGGFFTASVAMLDRLATSENEDDEEQDRETFCTVCNLLATMIGNGSHAQFTPLVEGLHTMVPALFLRAPGKRRTLLSNLIPTLMTAQESEGVVKFKSDLWAAAKELMGEGVIDTSGQFLAGCVLLFQCFAQIRPDTIDPPFFWASVKQGLNHSDPLVRKYSMQLLQLALSGAEQPAEASGLEDRWSLFVGLYENIESMEEYHLIAQVWETQFKQLCEAVLKAAGHLEIDHQSAIQGNGQGGHWHCDVCALTYETEAALALHQKSRAHRRQIESNAQQAGTAATSIEGAGTAGSATAIGAAAPPECSIEWVEILFRRALHHPNHAVVKYVLSTFFRWKSGPQDETSNPVEMKGPGGRKGRKNRKKANASAAAAVDDEKGRASRTGLTLLPLLLDYPLDEPTTASAGSSDSTTRTRELLCGEVLSALDHTPMFRNRADGFAPTVTGFFRTFFTTVLRPLASEQQLLLFVRSFLHKTARSFCVASAMFSLLDVFKQHKPGSAAAAAAGEFDLGKNAAFVDDGCLRDLRYMLFACCATMDKREQRYAYESVVDIIATHCDRTDPSVSFGCIAMLICRLPLWATQPPTARGAEGEGGDGEGGSDGAMGSGVDGTVIFAKLQRWINGSAADAAGDHSVDGFEQSWLATELQAAIMQHLQQGDDEACDTGGSEEPVSAQVRFEPSHLARLVGLLYIAQDTSEAVSISGLGCALDPLVSVLQHAFTASAHQGQDLSDEDVPGAALLRRSLVLLASIMQNAGVEVGVKLCCLLLDIDAGGGGEGADGTSSFIAFIDKLLAPALSEAPVPAAGASAESAESEVEQREMIEACASVLGSVLRLVPVAVTAAAEKTDGGAQAGQASLAMELLTGYAQQLCGLTLLAIKSQSMEEGAEGANTTSPEAEAVRKSQLLSIIAVTSTTASLCKSEAKATEGARVNLGMIAQVVATSNLTKPKAMPGRVFNQIYFPYASRKWNCMQAILKGAFAHSGTAADGGDAMGLTLEVELQLVDAVIDGLDYSSPGPAYIIPLFDCMRLLLAHCVPRHHEDQPADDAGDGYHSFPLPKADMSAKVTALIERCCESAWAPYIACKPMSNEVMMAFIRCVIPASLWGPQYAYLHVKANAEGEGAGVLRRNFDKMLERGIRRPMLIQLFTAHCCSIWRGQPVAAIPYLDSISELLIHKEPLAWQEGAGGLGRADSAPTPQEQTEQVKRFTRVIVCSFLDGLPSPTDEKQAAFSTAEAAAIATFVRALVLKLLQTCVAQDETRQALYNTWEYGATIRSLQTLCILAAKGHINRELLMGEDTDGPGVGEILFGKLLMRPALPPVRHFMELFAIQLATSFPFESMTAKGWGLLPLLGDVSLRGNQASTVALIAAFVIKTLPSTHDHYALLRRQMARAISPYLCHATGHPRTIAQVVIGDLLEDIEQEQAEVRKHLGAGEDGSSYGDGSTYELFLGGMVAMIRGNKDIVKMVKRQTKHFNGYNIRELCTLRELLKTKVDEFNEFEPLELCEQIKTTVEEVNQEILKEDRISKLRDVEVIAGKETDAAADMADAVAVPDSFSFQRKIQPWAELMDAIEADKEAMRTQEGRVQALRTRVQQEVIMCASLVDKLPNLAGLSRTCEIFGASKLLIPNKALMSNPIWAQISVTAEKWVPVEEVTEAALPQYLRQKKREGFKILGLEQTSTSQCLSEYSFPDKVLFVLGKEKEGIPADIIGLLDVCIEIPQLGLLRSLNVHVSGAILIWAYTQQALVKQRQKALLSAGDAAGVAS
jgi:tRNA G18 (ribose-2'-O)-methylase SpoU